MLRMSATRVTIKIIHGHTCEPTRHVPTEGLRVPVAACCNDGDPNQLIDLTLLNRPPYIFRSCVGVGDGKAECG